ncbi:PAS domain S-box-containing protein [Noviherbaspirillum humi]|uniref:histidine kinase n=1 Tax=Noviherbaspirillum humi TaxID=1688639 RepID=A0A239DRB3_9BURK|nr:sensor histidine kinase [Noviherbaspirillum humi]SNS35056.1 PAS domain S-box-containing protein [Noviherbaspirillum humi]
MKLKDYIFERGLGAYLALAFSLLSVVLTLILVEVIDVVATEQARGSIGNSLADLALQTTDKLDRSMFERYREVQLMAMRPDLRGAATDSREKRQVLDSRQETYPFYSWIGLVATDGTVQVATKGMLEGSNVSTRPWFKEALQAPYIGDVHDAVMLSKRLPHPEGRPLRFLDLAFPYADQTGRIAGVLGVHLSWEWAREVGLSVIEPVAARRQVQGFIVSREGLVLWGPEAMLGQKLNLDSLRAAQKSRRGYTIESWDREGRFVVGFSKSPAHEGQTDLGWTVLVLESVDSAFAPVKAMQRQVLWAGLGIAILFSLIGLLAARRITQPLLRLAQSAQRIQYGQGADIDPGAENYYESKVLATSLRSLVTDLLYQKAALQELNQSLEQRVEARTRELAGALANVKANERRIQTITETAQDAFIAVDLHGNVTDWNSQAERMFGWTRGEAVGHPLADRVVPQRFRDSYQRSLREVNETGMTGALNRRLERVVMNRSGQEFPVEMTVGLAGTDETAFLSVFLHDISARKQVERMKNEFISTVSHELRTPLTSIRASLGMLADGMVGEFDPEAKELLQIANDSCERLVRLVNDMLDIEKIESGKMAFRIRALPLEDVARQAMEATRAYAEGFGIRLTLVNQAPGMRVMADDDRMTQVAVNLLSNAIKFSPRGGEVEVVISRAEGQGRLAVIDHGCGVPDAFRDRIFQKFAQADATDTRQKGGTGLGLSICKSIVEQHGGRIHFESDADHGTTFFVDLPLAAAHAAATAE